MMRTTSPIEGGTNDDVVLLDEDGTSSGRAPRSSVHTESTPLHLAFSCYLHDGKGRVLLTRRALTKRAWPGVWTNSFCGHPRPGEAFADAVHRYARREVGMQVHDLRPLLPDFSYRAVDASGIVENEVCPVFTARSEQLPEPHPDEVMDLRWVTGEELEAAVRAAPWALSPWMLEQMAQLGGRQVDTQGCPLRAVE